MQLWRRVRAWLTPGDQTLMGKARTHVAWAEGLAGASPKVKREEVRRRLQKDFPTESLRKIYLAIERAVDERG